VKISDNSKHMTNKIDEDLKRKIKDEFVHGYMDGEGVRQYPTILALSKRHDVANVSLHRRSKSENWQAEKNRVQTEYENAVTRERMAKMLAYGSRLDDNAINLALGLMGDAGRRLSEDVQNRDRLRQLSELPDGYEKDEELSKFFLTTKILTTQDINSLGHAVANAQKIGKLALGQAQEISKVSANVELPESLREVLDQLDELAEQKASGAQHTLQ
jgi:hypothetical protein